MTAGTSKLTLKDRSLLLRNVDGHSPTGYAVTFDCWDTLIYIADLEDVQHERVEALRRSIRREGLDEPDEVLCAALDKAWKLHWDCWEAQISSGPEEIARWALETFRVGSEDEIRHLTTDFAELALGSDVRALETAPLTLERLALVGVRRALVCDTGYTPGYIVRRLLAREGLLDLLEVQIFSDEVRVPKPNARAFHAALSSLDAHPQTSVHVGDLRRTDVAGARGVGMGTVRLRDRHDDLSDHPEADAVADSHAHLREILGVDEE